MITLSDTETAVLIDSLRANRELFEVMGQPTPNIDSALDKINSLMTPTVTGLSITGINYGFR